MQPVLYHTWGSLQWTHSTHPLLPPQLTAEGRPPVENRQDLTVFWTESCPLEKEEGQCTQSGTHWPSPVGTQWSSDRGPHLLSSPAASFLSTVSRSLSFLIEAGNPVFLYQLCHTCKVWVLKEDVWHLVCLWFPVLTPHRALNKTLEPYTGCISSAACMVLTWELPLAAVLRDNLMIYL